MKVSFLFYNQNSKFSNYLCCLIVSEKNLTFFQKIIVALKKNLVWQSSGQSITQVKIYGSNSFNW